MGIDIAQLTTGATPADIATMQRQREVSHLYGQALRGSRATTPPTSRGITSDATVALQLLKLASPEMADTVRTLQAIGDARSQK